MTSTSNTIHRATLAAQARHQAVIDILVRAKELLMVPFGWNKNGVVDSAWEETCYTDEDACAFDCYGALLRGFYEVKGNDFEYEVIEKYMEKKVIPLLGFSDAIDLGMFEVNQEGKHPVIARLDTALIRARTLASKKNAEAQIA